SNAAWAGGGDRRSLASVQGTRHHRPAPNQMGRGGAGAGHLAAASSSSPVKPRVLAGSTGMLGPMLVVIAIFLRYRPLAADGLSRSTSSRAAAKVANRFSARDVIAPQNT